MNTHATVLSWEKAAICGLGDWSSGVRQFVQAGTNLRITNDCSPGFKEHAVAAGETIVTIGALYGITGNKLWNHAYNATLRGTRPLGIQVGDVLNIPRKGTNVPLLRRL